MALRLASPDYGLRATRSRQSSIEITSWLGATPLGEIPVVLGTWEIGDEEDAQVPGSLKFSVPNTAEWRPVTPDHPLARMGQELQVRAGHITRSGSELLQMGRYRITSAEPDGEVITVEARGLLINVQRARFLSPFNVPAGTTRHTAIRRLLQGILPVAFEVGDETMPTATWDRERLDAVREVVQAWPARVWVDDTGVVVVSPPWPDRVTGTEYTFEAGVNLMAVQPAATPESDYNGYSVSTVPEGDEQPVTGQFLLPDGPMRWGGPYGFYPGFYASPVLKPDRVQLNRVAKTMAERGRRRNETVRVTALPDERVQVGTTARIVSASYEGRGMVTKVQHTRSALDVVVAVSL